MSALLDTSVVIGPRPSDLAEGAAVSTVPIAELRLGVLLAGDAATRAARLARLVEVERLFRALPVDDGVASAYATIVATARESGRRPKTMDALIAATAVANDLVLYTRDRGLRDQAPARVVLVTE